MYRVKEQGDLEGKYSRRLGKFEGYVTKLRGWMFDLGVAIWQVDKELSGELDKLSKPEQGYKWDPHMDDAVTQELQGICKAELYGVLCSTTQGEANNIVRGILDSRLGMMGSELHDLKPQV